MRSYRAADPSALSVVTAKIVFETDRTQYKKDVHDAVQEFRDSVPMEGEWESYTYGGMMKIELSLDRACYPTRANEEYVQSHINDILRSHPIKIEIVTFDVGPRCN